MRPWLTRHRIGRWGLSRRIWTDLVASVSWLSSYLALTTAFAEIATSPETRRADCFITSRSFRKFLLSTRRTTLPAVARRAPSPKRTIDPLNLASAAKDVKPISAIPAPIRVEIAPEKNCSPCQMTEWLCLASSPKKSSSLASFSVADKASPAPERVTEGHKEKGARPSRSGRGWGTRAILT